MLSTTNSNREFYDFYTNYMTEQHENDSATQHVSFFDSLGEDIAPILLFNLLLDFQNSGSQNFKEFATNEERHDIVLYVNPKTKKYFISYPSNIKEYIEGREWIEDEEILLGSEGITFLLGYRNYFLEFLDDFSKGEKPSYEGIPVKFMDTIDTFRNRVEEYVNEEISRKIEKYLSSKTMFSPDIPEQVMDQVLKDCQKFIPKRDYSKLLSDNDKLISIINRDTKRFNEMIKCDIKFDEIWNYCKEQGLLK